MSRSGTANCLSCRNPAVIYGGHVHYGQGNKTSAILAGWCKEHGRWDNEDCKENARPHCGGCYGEWQPWMGFTVLEGA